MRKRGLSQVVTIMLVTAVFLLIVTVAWMAMILILESLNPEKDIKEFVNCAQEVKIEILNVCHKNNLLKMQIQNKGELLLGDFFLVRVTYANNEKETIPTPYHSYIEAYETNTIVAAYTLPLKEIEVIPRVNSTGILCEKSSQAYSNINSCFNENEN